MQRAGTERGGAELLPPAGIQVELHGIAVPDLVVRADVGRVLVEAAQADVKVLLIPEEKELPATVGEVGMADVDRGHKGSVPIGQRAVHRDRLVRFRDQADDGILLGGGSTRGEGTPKNHQEEPFSMPNHIGSTSTPRAPCRTVDMKTTIPGVLVGFNIHRCWGFGARHLTAPASQSPSHFLPS